MYKMFKKNMSNLGVIISLIVLLSEISILPSIQIGIYGQQEQQQKIGIRKIKISKLLSGNHFQKHNCQSVLVLFKNTMIIQSEE